MKEPLSVGQGILIGLGFLSGVCLLASTAYDAFELGNWRSFVALVACVFCIGIALLCEVEG